MHSIFAEYNKRNHFLNIPSIGDSYFFIESGKKLVVFSYICSGINTCEKCQISNNGIIEILSSDGYGSLKIFSHGHFEPNSFFSSKTKIYKEYNFETQLYNFLFKTKINDMEFYKMYFKSRTNLEIKKKMTLHRNAFQMISINRNELK